VLALDDVFDTGLASLLDTFTFANALGPSLGRGAPRFDVRVVGMRRRIKTHHGLRLDTAPIEGRAPAYLVMPALFAASPGDMATVLARRDVTDACDALADHQRTTLAAACTSTFVLAEAGVLDDQRATTTWWLAPTFRERFPAVELDASRMVIEAPGRVTAGAAMAHVDLALWIVRQASPALASMVARYPVVEPRPSQAPFIIPDHLAHADPLVERQSDGAKIT
jgi:transcriptional regulator GlxA family with amidase domain